MEAAGASTKSNTGQSTAQLSSKKSPKKNPKKNVIFRHDNNNTSPKRSVNNLSSSNNNLQNGLVSFPMPFQNGPSTSTNNSQGEPVPRCIQTIKPFTFALKVRENKLTPKVSSQENVAVSEKGHLVDSLLITVKNDGDTVPPQRMVQNNVIQPQKAVQNDVIQPQMVSKNAIQTQATVKNDATAPTPFQFRFPQTRPFQYDQQKRFYPRSAQPFARAQQVQNNEHSQQVNGEPSYLQQQQQQQQQQPHNKQQLQPPHQQLVQQYLLLQQQSQKQQQPQQYQQRQPQQHPSQRPAQQHLQQQRQPQQYHQQQQRQAQQQQQWQYWRQRQRLINEEQGLNKKVLVTGFPAYARADELARKLSVFGSPKVEVFKNRVAVVHFQTDEEAGAALNGNDTIALYGTILSIVKYCSRKHALDTVRANRREVRHEHKGPPVAAPTEIDLSGDFAQQMQNIEDAIRLTQDEVNNINLLFEDVEKYMRLIYPTCEAVPFGSITTGQGIKSSDADCFLALAPGTAGRPGRGAAELSSVFVNKAAQVLRSQPLIFAQVLPIPRANTPIIKFLHLPTNVHCDLNSKTPLGVQNSRLVGHLLRRDPRLGAAALLLKYWARVHQLSGTGRLTNYALLLLLVFYLQRSLLPPVCELQGPEHRFIIENWDAGFDNSPLPFLREVPPLRDLLGGFFLYYSSFDFENLVVCPFLGRPLRKAEFESNVLPQQFELYRHNLKERLALPVRTNSCLCVQDPFELSHNVASAISYRLALDIKAYIKHAATAYVEEEKSPGDFVRRCLVSHGRGSASGSGSDSMRCTPRVSLPARLLADLQEPWREAARTTVLDHIFRDVMFVDLTRRDSVSREPDVDLEVYVGNANRPIWKRDVHRNVFCPTPADMLNLHRETSELIVNSATIPDVCVPFEVELGFRSKPRGLSITTNAMDGADPEAFRSFRQFFHTFVHRWHKELLNPYLRKDPPRTEETSRNVQKNPKNTSPKKTRRGNRSTDPSRNRQDKPDSRPDLDPPIETKAFVNTSHKELCESVAAVTIVDSSKQDLTEAT